MAVPARGDLSILHFPGTIHYVNPKHGSHDEDTILISEFGRAVRWAGIALAIYILLVAIHLITSGVESMGFHAVSTIVGYATHPFLAVLAGLFLTFFVQSSTVVTAITVATVGVGVVPVDMAAMLIMGANVGTCFTAQLVAFGFYRNACDLKRALSAGMTHWWFNVLSLAVLFPLEVAFKPLTHSAGWLSDHISGAPGPGLETTDVIGRFVEPVVSTIGVAGLIGKIGSTYAAGGLSIMLGIILIVTMIRWITHLMTEITAASSQLVLEHSVERSDSLTSIRSILAGLGLTMMSQSSSATICSAIPFAGTGTLSLRKFLGIVLGANLGTTLTAVLTAIAVPGDNSELALQAALIHVLFNLVGLIVVVAARPAGRLIVWLSEKTADMGVRWPVPVFLGLAASYTIIPLGIIAVATW